MSMEQLSRLHEDIPRDRDVVVYCTCPNEASSGMTALRLRQLGITRVRPLAGGYFAWRQRGLPLDSPFGLVPPPQKIGDFARKATPLSDGLL
jgi:rhodanese-related sulfurtransferase